MERNTQAIDEPSATLEGAAADTLLTRMAQLEEIMRESTRQVLARVDRIEGNSQQKSTAATQTD